MLKVLKAPRDLGPGVLLPRGSQCSVPHHSPLPRRWAGCGPSTPQAGTGPCRLPPVSLSPRPCLWPEES